MTRPVRLLLAGLLVSVCVLLPSTIAAAHANLASSDPPANAQLAAARAS